jgi:uncharacterized SAM-binding protein YcdF (DUF218 family)
MQKIINNFGTIRLPSLWLRIHFGLVLFLCGAIVFLLIWIERSAICTSISQSWIVSDDLEPANAAAILGGGVDTRPGVAARLYRDGLVKRIVVFGTGLSQTDLSAANNSDLAALFKLGIPTRAITELGGNPGSTYQEATALKQWAVQNKVQRIIVPTEIFPSRRVRWILRRELGKVGIRIMIATVAPPDYDADDWWQHRAGIVDFQNEIIKYLYYRIRY